MAIGVRQRLCSVLCFNCMLLSVIFFIRFSSVASCFFEWFHVCLNAMAISIALPLGGAQPNEIDALSSAMAMAHHLQIFSASNTAHCDADTVHMHSFKMPCPLQIISVPRICWPDQHSNIRLCPLQQRICPFHKCNSMTIQLTMHKRIFTICSGQYTKWIFDRPKRHGILLLLLRRSLSARYWLRCTVFFSPGGNRAMRFSENLT